MEGAYGNENAEEDPEAGEASPPFPYTFGLK